MKIYVAGHRGMVGAAIINQLLKHEVFRDNLQLITKTHSELDLTDQSSVRHFMASERPDIVIIAAAKVGGIHANNTYPAEFIYQNLMIQSNLIHEGYRAGVKKVLFLGSSCIYPRMAEQPMREDALLTGLCEPTNEPYAIAKISGIKLCESYNRQFGVDYRSIMPTNLYGPGDNFHPENSHVVPALIQRFHEAKVKALDSVSIWGSGKVLREFLHVDDMASASLFVLNISEEKYASQTSEMLSHLNVGSGREVTISELATLIGKVVGFEGTIEYDVAKPDGAPRKLMDSSKLSKLGWTPKIDLEIGLKNTYLWYRKIYLEQTK